MKKKLVILGSGFGAFSLLKRINTGLYDIKIISPRNHFLFTPLLPSTTVGTIEFRSIIEPIRNIKGAHFYQAVCNDINTDSKKISCYDTHSNSDFDIDYDILVIAVGELTNPFGIHGVKEYAYFLREVSDARKIRIKVIDCFEIASLPGLSDEDKKHLLSFVVCGGGPTGVEFAAELHDFVDEEVSKKYPELTQFINVTLIEAGEKLLNSFDEKLSTYTMKNFLSQKIIVKTKSYIQDVTEKEIFLNDGSKIPYGLLVWATGNIASELIAKTNLPKTRKNKIIVDRYLKVLGFDDIYSLGDCSEYSEHPFPVTAQTAQQQGKYLGKTLNKLAKGAAIKPFKFNDLGMLAYIGNHKALANTPAYKASGFGAWLFWRSVYITKLVSLKNKVLVLFDWFKTFIFGRDVSNF
jgi:NADH:ubiquinone reductase (non-electrogenic)